MFSIQIQEYELECTKDSLGQMSICKAENVRKDEIIASLRKELAAYKKNSWSKDIRYLWSKHSQALSVNITTCPNISTVSAALY